MIPILMQNETVVGFLPDALSCVVTEERNGVFELTLTYPVTGKMFPEIAIDRFVKAKPNDTADLQLFRIYEVTKPMNGVVTINAEHVSYALAHFPVIEASITGTATQAINELLSDVTDVYDYFDKTNPFRAATTDMDSVKTFQYKIGTVRAALGGSEGSILDVFGGEYEFDNFVIRLHKNRGKDTGIVIAYGKNMTDIKVTTSLESAYTALYPYAIKDERLYIADVWEFETEPTIHFIEYDPIMPVQNKSGIADRILVKDFSREFTNEETMSNRTLAEKAEKWLQQNDIKNRRTPQQRQQRNPLFRRTPRRPQSLRYRRRIQRQPPQAVRRKQQAHRRPPQTARRKPQAHQRPPQTVQQVQPRCRQRTQRKAAMSCPLFRSVDPVIARSAATRRSPTEAITVLERSIDMKKGLCALAIVLVLLPLGLTAHAGDMPTIPLNPPRVAGDANGDRTVDLRDAAVLTRHLAGGWNVTINEKNADVNGDNTVDLKDVVLIRRYLAGGWNVKLK